MRGAARRRASASPHDRAVPLSEEHAAEVRARLAVTPLDDLWQVVSEGLWLDRTRTWATRWWCCPVALIREARAVLIDRLYREAGGRLEIDTGCPGSSIRSSIVVRSDGMRLWTEMGT